MDRLNGNSNELARMHQDSNARRTAAIATPASAGVSSNSSNKAGCTREDGT